MLMEMVVGGAVLVEIGVGEAVGTGEGETAVVEADVEETVGVETVADGAGVAATVVVSAPNRDAAKKAA